MSVMIQVDFLLYPVGHSDFLHAFFSTVCRRLEHGRWGSRYPYLMNSLYQGRLEWTDISLARKELEEVARRLKRHPPSSVVWDIDDLSKQPPWGNHISEEITSLANYFVTSDGRDLIDVLRLAFRDAEELRHCIEIVS